MADAAEAALAAENLPRAIELFSQAEPDVKDPDRCAGGRWMAHMLGGEFGAAWRESDAIRQRGAADPHRFWNGEPLQGRRLMLRCLHGFGDAVQMFRFLPRLQARVSSLVVEVPPRLLEMAPCFDDIGEVITWGEAAPAHPVAWDVQMEIMEVPYALRVTAADLAPCNGYLRLPEAIRQRAAAFAGRGPGPRVGVVWTAGQWNPSRSIPFEIFARILATAEVEFWSLQGGLQGDAWSRTNRTPLRDVYECGDGIATLAAVVERMDLVITVDTLAAHLAGALNVPCWLLLQHRADWRWMAKRDRSPWYPSLQLWRQRRQNDWVELVERVGQALAAAARAGHLRQREGAR